MILNPNFKPNQKMFKGVFSDKKKTIFDSADYYMEKDLEDKVNNVKKKMNSPKI